MLFNSVEFLLFFIVVYGIYIFLNHRWQNFLLLFASCFFYATWNWKFLALMFLSITTDFYCSKYIFLTSDKNKKRVLLFISLFVNLSILGLFKYFNFFLDNVYNITDFIWPSNHIPRLALNIILPLGISFYTFEAISYAMDVYRGIMKPALKYWDYVLFVIYFPHLIAGPIMRAKDFLPQIVVPRKLTLDQFYEGGYLVFWGLFEKIFVADNLAKIVDMVFAKQVPYQGAEVLVALYAFAFQVFCDFDGYSNIARGLGKCMGFDIMVNFNLPFFSTSIQEYWNRWHISLSHWIRDYLYLPLMSGLRKVKGNMRIFIALFVSMSLVGLWHGAAWNFIIWGAYYGLLLAFYLVIRMRWGKLIVPKTLWGRWLWFLARVVFVFHLTVVGMLMFRSLSLNQFSKMFISLFSNFHITSESLSLFIRFLLITTPLLIVQLIQFKNNDLMIIYKSHRFIKIAFYAALTYLMLGWGVFKAEQFIYFQF